MAKKINKKEEIEMPCPMLKQRIKAIETEMAKKGLTVQQETALKNECDSLRAQYYKQKCEVKYGPVKC